MTISNRSVIAVSNIGNSQFHCLSVTSIGSVRWLIYVRILKVLTKMSVMVFDLSRRRWNLHRCWKCLQFARGMSPLSRAKRSPRWLHKVIACYPIDRVVLQLPCKYDTHILGSRRKKQHIWYRVRVHHWYLYIPQISTPSFNSYWISFALSDSVSMSDCLIWCSRLLNFAFTIFPKNESIFILQHMGSSFAQWNEISMGEFFDSNKSNNYWIKSITNFELITASIYNLYAKIVQLCALIRYLWTFCSFFFHKNQWIQAMNSK